MRFTKLSSLFIVPIITILCCIATFSASLSASAASINDVCGNPNVAPEIQAASGCPSTGTTEELPNVIQTILNSVIGVTGVVAVIFIIVGGFNYMTSNGDANKVTKAKSTILYALIGLAICAFAFAIVNFVIINIIGGTKVTQVEGGDTLSTDVVNVINGVIAVLGIGTVIAMIVGGYNYMTSAGDTAKTTKARNTIIYALIGLIVCVLAFAIVNFVINNVIGYKPTPATAP